MNARLALRLVATALVAGMAPAVLHADTFTYVDRQGQTQTVEGLLAGSGQGMHAIEKADGQILLISQGALQQRVAAEGPVPLTPREMADQLAEEFGTEGIRTLVDGQYVIGLVLAGPLPARSETRVTGFLADASKFFKSVESVLSRFCRKMRIDTVRPRYPLVILVFESDRDFETYTSDASGGMGLSADRILGFYSPLTNRLAIRIGECRSFQVPLHEAVHQQVFNRGILQRLAGVPVWFNEGIATGFENDGERINIGPEKVNATYAKRVRGELSLSWEDIVKDDAAFSGDVIAGEAYAQAWSLHWMLVTEQRTNYVRYLKKLGQIAPLEQPTAEERAQLFEESFDAPLAELEGEFPRLLQAALRKQRLDFDKQPRPGYSVTYGDASEVQLTAVQLSTGDDLIEVQGRLLNASPFRTFAYYVTVQTTGGLYADWFLPSVESEQVAKLPQQFVVKAVPGGPGTDSQSFWVEVTSALPDSDEVADWKANGFPIPQWKPR